MIASIENAILARLKAASDGDHLGYRFRKLETYPDDWDEYLKTQSSLPAPAAWTTFAGWAPTDDSEAWKPQVVGLFGLVVLAENARNERATRHGDPTDQTKPGSYQLIEDAVGLLAGRDLGLPITGFEIGRLRFVARLEALQKRPVSMLALELRTRFFLDLPDQQFDDEAIGDFRTFHVNWDIPPFGNVGPEMPDDEHADATDHIVLETNT